MTIARSMLKGNKFDVEFPEERKPLDLADKYDSLYLPEERAYFPDEEPTVKIQVPVFKNQVVVGETRYPGVGLLIAFGTGLAFWGTVAYFIFR
jgi:hypothetical protein